MPEFVAVDGEADSDGNYILLCDSTDREPLIDLDGIKTAAALEWLLALKKRHRQVVCFGLNYDVNQWLANVAVGTKRAPGPLRDLVTEAETVWRHYRLAWWPRTKFTITDLHSKRRSITVCEVWGFFQGSFERALHDWGLPVPKELSAMKRRRGTFNAAAMAELVRYCESECRLLVELMDRLSAATDTAGCSPNGMWIGAGAIAAALHKAHGVSEHHHYDHELTDQTEPILGSYYGARSELLRQGELGSVQTADIRSAYPSAMCELPSLAGATVRYRRRYRPEAPWAIWRVRWSEQAHKTLAPFPCRADDGSIWYPQSGAGYYHSVEVANALRLGYEVEILEGWELVIRSPELPFDWIPALYRKRERLKSKGIAAEKALKLGLNSLYGKLAQGFSVGSGGSRLPPYQNYWWAGYITAKTRARMLDLAHRSDRPAMIATDGLFAASTPARGARSGLGTWELGELDRFFSVQAGVYSAYDREERCKCPGSCKRHLVRSRGFFARDVDFGEVRDGWREDGPRAEYRYRSRRFIGAKVALHRNDLDLWRSWVDQSRALSFYIEDRKVPAELDQGARDLYPPRIFMESEPYRPKGSRYDIPSDWELHSAIVDDQPHFIGA